MDVHSLKGFDPSPYMASLNHSNQLTANTVVPLSTHHFINYSIPSHTIINYYQVPKKIQITTNYHPKHRIPQNQLDYHHHFPFPYFNSYIISYTLW